MNPYTVGDPPDGPVELWVIVFTGDGTVMGAARSHRQPRWLWRKGHLALNYSPVNVTIDHAGTYTTGLICAVATGTRVFRPLWPITLGPPQHLRVNDNLHIEDGVIQIIPDLPGPHG